MRENLTSQKVTRENEQKKNRRESLVGCQLSDVFLGGRLSDYLQRVATLYNLFVACNSFHMFPISKPKKLPFKETLLKRKPKHLRDFYCFFLGEIRW